MHVHSTYTCRCVHVRVMCMYMHVHTSLAEHTRRGQSRILTCMHLCTLCTWVTDLHNKSMYSIVYAVLSPLQIVCVWEIKNVGSRDRSPVQLQLKHTLHGHTDAVTCIAASTAYNIIVSGSKVRPIYSCVRYIYFSASSVFIGLIISINCFFIPPSF